MIVIYSATFIFSETDEIHQRRFLYKTRKELTFRTNSLSGRGRGKLLGALPGGRIFGFQIQSGQ
jgi:hypothetical protein